MFTADGMLIGSFKKNGLVYHVLIEKDSASDPENLIEKGKFKGVFLHPLKKEICTFYIGMDEEGNWMPDDHYAFDPWISDYVGKIIENNLV